MPRCWPVLVILATLTGTPLLLSQEGKLEKVRKEVNGETTHATAKKSARRKTNSNDDCCDDGDDDDLGATLAWICLAGPFALPHDGLGDSFQHDGYFLPYPYFHGQAGSMCIDRHGHDSTDGEPPVAAWLLRVSLEDGNGFSGMNRLGGRLLLDSTYRWGLQGSWNWYNERLDAGRQDDTFIGDANVVFRFAQSEQAQFRAGLGGRMMADRFNSHYGFNFTYGADFFPARPFVLSSQMDLGTLGSVGVVHGEVTGGLLYRGWELYGGYDFLRVGTVNLQGPLLGLRWWF